MPQAPAPVNQAPAAANCLQVFYDFGAVVTNGHRRDEVFYARHMEGLFHAELARRQLRLINRDITTYLPGEVNQCRFNIYIGTLFNNRVPSTFVQDFFSSNAWVMWVGYNIWQTGPAFDAAFGYHYAGIAKLNGVVRDAQDRPTFFREVNYGGRTFVKYGEWSRLSPGAFDAPFEMELLVPASGPARSEVLATARHNGTGKVVPYLLRSGPRFYLADNPFSYVDLNSIDRHIIIRDLVAQALEAPPVRRAN